jgi:hypothetical protein
MQIYDLIIQNKDFLKVFYALIIGIICFTIVMKTNKLFKLSLHQGIRYFRNAFLFYGLAFITRYFFIGASVFYSLNQILFEFFLIMAGFSLLYSLLWKKFERQELEVSSLFNIRIILFYVLALIVVILDYLWKTYCFMFGLQIVIFIYAVIVSYMNYIKDKDKKFLKLYFGVIILNLIEWILNFIVATFFKWNQIIVINIYILNIIIFSLFLYGVLKVTQNN